MPRVILTKEQRREAVCEQRDRMLISLIQSKMVLYGIPVETLCKTVGIAKSSMYRRLQRPSERFSFNELCALFGVLRISNEEISNVIRR
jgi:hypothetical protein